MRTGTLPRQNNLGRDFAAAKIIWAETLPRQSQKNNGTNRRVSQAILPRQVPRLIFGAAIAEARYFAGKLNVSNTGTDPLHKMVTLPRQKSQYGWRPGTVNFPRQNRSCDTVYWHEYPPYIIVILTGYIVYMCINNDCLTALAIFSSIFISNGTVQPQIR